MALGGWMVREYMNIDEVVAILMIGSLAASSWTVEFECYWVSVRDFMACATC